MSITQIAAAAAAAAAPAPGNAAAASEPWAEVRCSDRVMRYRRSGAGPTMLLLGAGTPSSPLSTELVAALGARFRVIVPDLPADADVIAWVSDFLEGLGTGEVTLFATDQLCMPAIELAFRGIEQVKRLVLIPDGEPDGSTSEGSIATSLGEPPIPVLIVRPGQSIIQMLPHGTTFVVGA
jgi:pimeloyl-ACP methyl ester carboxylesterase